MSVEDDVEFQDLLYQTLEANGCLPKIRAQLRASTFLALDEDVKLSKSQPLINAKVRNSQETPEGKLMFCVVREFLEFFNLDFTISVFEAESYFGSGYKYEGRGKTMQNLGIAIGDNENVPLLMHLIKIAQNKSKSIEINLMNGTNGIVSNGNSSNSSFSSESISNPIDKNDLKPDGKSEKSDKSNEEVKTDIDSLSINHNDAILNQTFNVNSPKIVSQISSNTISNEEFTNNNIKSKVIEKIKPLQNNNLSSLSDLPPLQNKSYHPRGNNDVFPVLHTKELKEKANLKELDKLFDVRQDYEEDFMSLEEYDSESKNKNSNELNNSNPDNNNAEKNDKNDNSQIEGRSSNKSDSDNTSISSENDNSETATSL